MMRYKRTSENNQVSVKINTNLPGYFRGETNMYKVTSRLM